MAEKQPSGFQFELAGGEMRWWNDQGMGVSHLFNDY